MTAIYSTEEFKIDKLLWNKELKSCFHGNGYHNYTICYENINV